MRRVLWGAAAVVAVVVVGLLLAGWRPVVLLSDSMAPAAPRGALLVTRPVAPAAVEVGDIVTVPVESVGRVTHRVVALEQLEGTRWARLQGDANDTPDPGRVPLPASTLRTVVVVPVLGRLLTGAGLLLLAGTGLVLVGGAGLMALRRRPATSPSPTSDTPLDPRFAALAATLEALADEGLATATLEALARVRTGALFGAGAVEEAPEAAGLDDGARFVLVALADADPAALRLVPSTSERASAAHAVVTAWWTRVGPHVPAHIRSSLATTLSTIGRRGGITGAGPVD